MIAALILVVLMVVGKWNWVVKDAEDYDCYVCSINYVHELQHAMRLCKIDKEFKVDGRRRKKV